MGFAPGASVSLLTTLASGRARHRAGTPWPPGPAAVPAASRGCERTLPSSCVLSPRVRGAGFPVILAEARQSPVAPVLGEMDGWAGRAPRPPPSSSLGHRTRQVEGRCAGPRAAMRPGPARVRLPAVCMEARPHPLQKRHLPASSSDLVCRGASCPLSMTLLLLTSAALVVHSPSRSPGPAGFPRSCPPLASPALSIPWPPAPATIPLILAVLL